LYDKVSSSPVRASTRLSLSFSSAPPSEETDSLVLTRRYPQETSAGSYVLERDDGLAFLGQIGERALGIARLGEGVAAWRDRMVDGEWKRFYAFGAGKEEIEKILPRLPGTIPAYWKEGETAKLGESRWTVRVIGRP